MATLEKIRERALLLVIVIGVALLAFLLGDFLRQGQTIFQNSQMNAIVVNGEAIKINKYNQRMETAMEMYKLQSNNQTLSDEQTNQLRNQIFNTIVAERILDEETSKLGMTVSAVETFDLVQGDFISPVILQNPMFINQETGAFDKVGLLQFLKSIDTKNAATLSAEQRAELQRFRTIWEFTEKSVRDYQLQHKYTSLLSKAVVANKLEVNDYIAANQGSADFAYVSQKAISAPDSIVSISQKDIQNFYDSHIELFKTEKASKVDIIYTTINPSKDDIDQAREDIAAAQKELQEGMNPADVITEYSDGQYIDAYMPISFFRNPYFNAEFSNQLESASNGFVSEVTFTDNTFKVGKLVDTKVAPDSLFISQMVVNPAHTDSILDIVKKDPSLFATVASANSLDRNTAGNGGEVGWMTEMMASRYINKEFSEAIFKAKVGEPFKFASQYGDIILLVSKATSPVKKYLVAYVTKQASPSSKTYSKLYNELSSFLTSNKSKENLDSLALAEGYQVHKDQIIYGMQPYIAQDIPQSRKLVRWALENKEGEVSDIEDCGGNQFAIAVIKQKIDKGYLPLKDVEDQIRPVVLSKAKTDKLYEQLKSSNYTSLNDFAQNAGEHVDSLKFIQFGSNRLDAIGYEPALNAAAIYAKMNTPTPVKGLNGVYLVNVYNRDDATEQRTPETAKSMLDSNVQGMVRMQALQVLIQKSDVEDNRVRFY